MNDPLPVNTRRGYYSDHVINFIRNTTKTLYWYKIYFFRTCSTIEDKKKENLKMATLFLSRLFSLIYIY